MLGCMIDEPIFSFILDNRDAVIYIDHISRLS